MPLFALLAGIRNYHPDSGVQPLRGPVNDTNKFEDYLRSRFPPSDLHIKKLIDKEVTRQGLIDSFIAHFIDNPLIRPGDDLLFYFSGHGSYEDSPPDFDETDSLRRNETLVCYDSRLDGHFDLADKEFRFLLARLPQETQIVIITDACHSGSITRALPVSTIPPNAKLTPARQGNAKRQLSQFLRIHDEGIEQFRNQDGKIRFPSSTYLALAACARNELAYEHPRLDEGIFTGTLLKIVNDSPGIPTYANLYASLYTFLKRQDNWQTPQLKVYGGFDPDRKFLLHEEGKAMPAFRIVSNPQGIVTINAGALHGLSNDQQTIAEVAVQVYSAENAAAAPQTRRLKKVGLDRSELDVWVGKGSALPAALINLPPTICILVKASEQRMASWKAFTETSDVQSIAFVYDGAAYHDIVLQLDENAVLLLEKDGGLLHGARADNEKAWPYIFQCCKQVAGWHGLIRLKNHSLGDSDVEKFMGLRFGIALKGKGKDGWVRQPSNQLELQIHDPGDKIPSRLYLDNESDEPWYCSVFFLSSRYGIRRMTTDLDESRLDKNGILKSIDREIGLSISQDAAQSVNRFKLIAARSPFQDYSISDKPDLLPHVVNIFRKTPAFRSMDKPVDADWYAALLTVTLRIR